MAVIIKRRMKKILYLSLIFTFLSCTNKNATTSTEDSQVTASLLAEPMEVKKEKDEILWISYEEAVKQAKKKKKKIFIDVYTDWCGWCKKMDKTTFKDPGIAAYMNKHYYSVKLNAESDKTITFQGKEMTERDLSSKVFRITGFPSTVYLEGDEKIIQPVPGYMDVPTLDKILHYIGEDHYKNQTWEQFQMSYQAE